MGWIRRQLERSRRLLLRRLYLTRRMEGQILNQFHALYYDRQLWGETWDDTRWMGTRIAKCPMDLWTYQELIYRTRPEALVECGTFEGGSALYFASLFDLIGHGRVLSIDISDSPARPQHPRITYIVGSSVEPTVLEQVKAWLQIAASVMIVLDSDHTYDHVLKELNAYCRFVTVGQYLIVEDTNLNGHPVAPEFGAGPHEAVTEFLQTHYEFSPDPACEKFLLSFNPGGYLRRVR